ncbi:DUF3322 domain-containing protein [Saccharomonospora sp.]|uniref:DUF3322 domain-containing protein n=1 Tax=Saccharomonospora sp. TaxID=33913 RepID=UPI0026297BAC|nr:DUF3322 domain-containing protein [Saccharomonospora sp.]
MLRPEDVIATLRRRFENGYPDWARGRGTWPIRLGLRPPTTQQRAADPVACHAWAEEWRAFPGPGVVEYVALRFPTGTHSMPKTLVVDSPHAVATANTTTEATWRRCGRRLTALQREFPQARFDRIIRRITELSEVEYGRLVATVRWLSAHPASGMLLRQLPIEGIDTKWLERHAGLVLPLLGAREIGAEDSRRLGLHERLGLRRPPELVQAAVLDPVLRDRVGGMRHFAASVDDLNRWTHRPDVVLILENTATAYALTDDRPGVVVLHGQGFSVARYSRIDWVHTASKVFYWGDIDLPGLYFLNDLRAAGVRVDSLLMDVATLEEFRHLAVEGSAPPRTALPHLTDTERRLHTLLTDHAATHGVGLLLEQERIPWPHADTVLRSRIRNSPNAT